MFSNLPTMLQAQDFDASHRDMVEAARGGVTVDPNAVTMRNGYSVVAEGSLLREATRRFVERAKAAEMDRMRVQIWAESNSLLAGAIEKGAKFEGAKIGATLRIRLPANYSVPDGPRFVPPERMEPDELIPLLEIKERTLSLQDYAERILHRSCFESLIPPPSSRD